MAQQLPLKTTDGQMECIKYSDKAVVIRGTKGHESSTRNHTAAFKEMSAKFQMKFTDPVTKQTFAGWMMPLSQIDKVQAFFKNLGSGGGGGGGGENANQNQNQNQNNNANANAGERVVSNDGFLELVKYSDKAFVVRGTAAHPSATTTHKTKLKDELSLKYNKFLKDPVTQQTFAGWLCWKSNYDKVAAWIKTATTPAPADGKNQKNDAAAAATSGEGEGDATAAAENKDNKNENNNAAATNAEVGQQIAVSADGKIEIIKYSAKSVAVRGTVGNEKASKKYSEKLQELKGKYIPTLKEPTNQEKRFAGYIFFLSLYDQVEEWLKSIEGGGNNNNAGTGSGTVRRERNEDDETNNNKNKNKKKEEEEDDDDDEKLLFNLQDDEE